MRFSDAQKVTFPHKPDNVLVFEKVSTRAWAFQREPLYSPINCERVGLLSPGESVEGAAPLTGGERASDREEEGEAEKGDLGSTGAETGN